MEATQSLIEASRGVVPTSAAIARAANISAPTFNLYFKDVGEAVLAVIQPMKDELNPIIGLLTEDWPKEELFDRARAFVKVYFGYWKAHASLLRVRNRLADDGDKRFVILRLEAADPLVAALGAKLAFPKVQSRVVGAPEHVASVLVVALERIATVNVLESYPKRRRNRPKLVDVLAVMIVNAILSA
jgi:AcrR family transcriptional regulator